jgi:hypothetical protein
MTGRNIAELVRNVERTFLLKRSIPQFLSTSTRQKVAALYSGPVNLPTRRGQWEVFSREDFHLPFAEGFDEPALNGFAAIYFSGESKEARTMVIGNITSEPSMRHTLEVLADNVLESSKHNPLKYINSENGGVIGAIAGIIIGTGVALYFLSQGGLQDDNRYVPLVFPFTLGFLGRIVGQEIGALVDRLRVQGLSRQFQFGSEAVAAVRAEYEQYRQRSEMADFDSALRESGVEVEPKNIPPLYGLLKVGFANRYVDMSARVGEENLAKVVEVARPLFF